jgi:hypothetical protein
MHVIHGGLAPRCIGALTLHVVRADQPLPLTPDAIVTEQDTWLALAPPRDVIVDEGSALRTHTRAHDAEPLAIGTVDVVHIAGRQALVRAIVIDVEAEPCCTPQFVEDAMHAAIVACRQRGIRSLRVPLLGTAHGKLTPSASEAAIERALARAQEGEPIDVVIVT